MPGSCRIEGGHGGRIDVDRGQLLDVVNVDGAQICDFFAFNRADVGEYLSPAHCRAQLLRLTLRVGDELVSVERRPMFEIVADDVGRHDMIFAACDPQRYLAGFGIADHRSCRTNLAEAMAGFDIPFNHLPDPINFFQNTPVEANGAIGYGAASLARPGDKVTLRALMDVVAVGSACPMDLTGINGDRLTDIELVVREG